MLVVDFGRLRRFVGKIWSQSCRLFFWFAVWMFQMFQFTSVAFQLFQSGFRHRVSRCWHLATLQVPKCWEFPLVFLWKNVCFLWSFSWKVLKAIWKTPGFGDALLYGSSTRLDFGSRDRLALEDLDPLNSEHGSLKRQIFLKFRLLDWVWTKSYEVVESPRSNDTGYVSLEFRAVKTSDVKLRKPFFHISERKHHRPSLPSGELT